MKSSAGTDTNQALAPTWARSRRLWVLIILAVALASLAININYFADNRSLGREVKPVRVTLVPDFRGVLPKEGFTWTAWAAPGEAVKDDNMVIYSRYDVVLRRSVDDEDETELWLMERKPEEKDSVKAFYFIFRPKEGWISKVHPPEGKRGD